MAPVQLTGGSAAWRGDLSLIISFCDSVGDADHGTALAGARESVVWGRHVLREPQKEANVIASVDERVRRKVRTRQDELEG